MAESSLASTLLQLWGTHQAAHPYGWFACLNREQAIADWPDAFLHREALSESRMCFHRSLLARLLQISSGLQPQPEYCLKHRLLLLYIAGQARAVVLRAGTLTWELIALDSKTGPAVSQSQPFSLKPLESKPLRLPQLTHLLHSVFNFSSSSSCSCTSCSSSSSSASCSSAAVNLPEACSRHRNWAKQFLSSVKLSAAALWGSKACSASRTRFPHAANAVVRIRAEIAKKASDQGTSSAREGMGRTDQSQQTFSNTRKGMLCQHEHEVMVNQSAAPNRQFLQQLHAVPHPAVLDALSSMPKTSELIVLHSEMKDKQVISSPRINVHSFTLLSPLMAEFVITSTAVALHVAIDTVAVGRFSDNNFMLLPWEPKVVAFLYDHSASSICELKTSMTFLSLADTKVQL